MNISIVLPAHNEAPNIQALCEQLLQRYDRHILEIIVVDDASHDSTGAIVQQVSRQHPCVRLVQRQAPSGVGRALKAGFNAVSAHAEYVLMMDCDFVENCDDIQRFIEKIGEGYDGVVGSRFIGGMRLSRYPWPKLIANRAFHLFARILLGITQHDLTNNFKLYRIALMRALEWRNDTFAINAETGLLPLLHHYRIAEVPVSWTQRSEHMGVSSFKVVRVGPQYLRVLWMACRLKWRQRRQPVTSASISNLAAQHPDEYSRTKTF